VLLLLLLVISLLLLLPWHFGLFVFLEADCRSDCILLHGACMADLTTERVLIVRAYAASSTLPMVPNITPSTLSSEIAMSTDVWIPWLQSCCS